MRFATWNVQSGCFLGYDEVAGPVRLPVVTGVVKELVADLVGLVDTWMWRERYANVDIAQMFGYCRAYCIDMSDTRVDPKIGLTVLTNEPRARFSTVRLYNRDAIRVMLDLPGRRLWVYLVYLDDLHASRREDQLEALRKLVAGHPDDPCVIMGDLNAVRPGAVGGWQLVGRALRLPPARVLARYAPEALSYPITALGGLLGGDQVVASLLRDGFIDAGAIRPTVATTCQQLGPATLSLPVDYILGRGLELRNYQVWNRAGSDHLPVTADLRLH